MNDRERIVEVLMGVLPDLPTPSPNVMQRFVKHIAANEVMGALEAAGYAIYRPDDCARTFITTTQAYERNVKAGAYRLVPVGGED